MSVALSSVLDPSVHVLIFVWLKMDPCVFFMPFKVKHGAGKQ
jgi:hypothetical protein